MQTRRADGPGKGKETGTSGGWRLVGRLQEAKKQTRTEPVMECN